MFMSKDKRLHQFKLRIINHIFCCQKKIQIKQKREEERDDTEHDNLIFLLANLIKFLSWAYSVYSTRHMDLKKWHKDYEPQMKPAELAFCFLS